MFVDATAVTGRGEPDHPAGSTTDNNINVRLDARGYTHRPLLRLCTQAYTHDMQTGMYLGYAHRPVNRVCTQACTQAMHTGLYIGNAHRPVHRLCMQAFA